MDADRIRAWLEQLDAAGAGEEAVVPLAYVAGQDVSLDEEELQAALRRALLLLAAGGDPQRALDLGDRTVTALADDLDDPSRRAQLAGGIELLRLHAHGLPRVDETLSRLARDPDRAWRAFACGVLADELAADDES